MRRIVGDNCSNVKRERDAIEKKSGPWWYSHRPVARRAPRWQRLKVEKLAKWLELQARWRTYAHPAGVKSGLARLAGSLSPASDRLGDIQGNRCRRGPGRHARQPLGTGEQARKGYSLTWVVTTTEALPVIRRGAPLMNSFVRFHQASKRGRSKLKVVLPHLHSGWLQAAIGVRSMILMANLAFSSSVGTEGSKL